MDKEKLIEEHKGYSVEELKRIESGQKSLYTPEEMDVIREMIQEKIKEEQQEQEAFIKAHLPEQIPCPKCESPNPFENDRCCYCGYTLDKGKFYQMDYYADKKEDDAQEYGAAPEQSGEAGRSYAFEYVISFLVPLVAFILAAILLSKESADQRSVGKVCIILGLVSTLLCVVTPFFALILPMLR